MSRTVTAKFLSFTVEEPAAIPGAIPGDTITYWFGDGRTMLHRRLEPLTMADLRRMEAAGQLADFDAPRGYVAPGLKLVR